MRLFVTFIFVLLCTNTIQAQRSLLVDNNIGATAGALKFLNLEDAIQAAQAGDVIYLTPSTDGYVWPSDNLPLRDKGNYTIKGAGLNTDLESEFTNTRSIITNKVEAGGAGSNVSEFVEFDGIVFQGGLTLTQANSYFIKNSTIYDRLEMAALQQTRFENNIMLL